MKDIIIGKNPYNKALLASASFPKIQNSKFRIQNCFSEFREISAATLNSLIYPLCHSEQNLFCVRISFGR